jgi:hypothetical protein
MTRQGQDRRSAGLMKVESNLNKRRKGEESADMRSKKQKRWGDIKCERSMVRKSKVIGTLTASSLAYLGQPVIGRLRGVLSGEGVEGRHVHDASRTLLRKLRVAISRGVRGIVGSVCVGDIAHRKRGSRQKGRGYRRKETEEMIKRERLMYVEAVAWENRKEAQI